MSERFEDFVADLVQTSAASPAPGPAAARRRAKQRRTRQRLAASTLTLALLGSAGGLAATLDHGGSGSVQVSHSGTPAPWSSASASPSPADTTTTPSAPSTNSGTGASLVPGTYAPGDWYNATEVPLSSSTITWVPDSDVSGTRIGGDVAEEQPSTGGYSGLSHFGDECQISSLSTGTSATEYENYTGYNDNGYLNSADSAIAANFTHLAYFYPSAAAAATAWNEIGSGFTNCAGAETGTDPSTGTHLTGATTRTTSASGTQCWSNVTTPTGNPAGGGTLDHVCLLQQGNVIAAVDVTVNFSKSAYVSTVDYSTFDSSLLHDLSAGLSGQLYSGDTPVCASGDLKVAFGPSGTYSVNGSRYQVLVLTNIAGSTCTVEGYPAAMLVDSSGKILDTSDNTPQDPNTAKVYSEAQITLAPGATGSAILSWSDTSNLGVCAYSGSNTLEVVAPYSTSATTLGHLSNVCDALVVTPIQPGVVTP